MRQFLTDQFAYDEPEPGVGGRKFYVRSGAYTMPDLEDVFKQLKPGVRDVVCFAAGRHEVGWYATRFVGGLISGLGNVPPGGPGASKIVTGDPGHELVSVKHEKIAWPAVDLASVKHWDAIGLNIVGSAFVGIRVHYAGGSEEYPTRVWGCRITNCEQSNIQVQGYYKEPWSPSGHVDIAGNDITGGDLVRETPEFNEGVYVGTGYSEWVDHTHHITVRANRISGVESDAIEVKTGVTDFVIEDNEISGIDLPAGTGETSVPVGFLTVQYANTPKPGTDVAVRGVVRRNRLYDLTQRSGLVRAPIVIGRGGVQCYSNIGWNHEAPTMILVGGGGGGMGAGAVEVAHNTSTGKVVDNVAGYPDLVEYANLSHAAEFVTGPTRGRADAGWGAGSGFTPGEPDASWEPGPMTDATGSAFHDPPPVGALNEE